MHTLCPRRSDRVAIEVRLHLTDPEGRVLTSVEAAIPWIQCLPNLTYERAPQARSIDTRSGAELAAGFTAACENTRAAASL